MKSNYKRLGDYIKEVDIRNREIDINLNLENIRGISSISKSFIKTKANLIDVESDGYKVVMNNQFAFNPNTARMGDKIPIGLNLGKPLLVSTIYPVFQIINPEKLNPEYLMMWFRRPEFDRYARYMSHGSAREVFGWDDMCDVRLPVPSIEKQREIVKEYNVIVDRINLNNQLIEKLEETAQTIYKQWFVDFEFPDENGNSYKSSGGEMEYCKELEKEIPKGWKIISIKEFCIDMKSGGTPSRDNPEYWNHRDIPWLKTGEVNNKVLVNAEEYISFEGCNNSSAKILPINSVLIAMYGEGKTKGQVGYLKFEAATNQACCAMICKDEELSSYLYYFLLINQAQIANMANGGAQPNLSKALIEDIRILKPDFSLKHPLLRILKITEVITRQNIYLDKLKDILLSKLATEEDNL